MQILEGTIDAVLETSERQAKWKRLEETAKKVEAYFELHKNEILLPHKYYPAVEHFMGERLKKQFDENPGTPLKDVLATTIQRLDPRIPPDKILELATFAAKKWQSFQQQQAAPEKPKSQRRKVQSKKELATMEA